MTREEIIKGLLDIHAVTANYKGDQVILHSMPMTKLTEILYGAAELLKAEAPRVLTLEELMCFDGAFLIEYNKSLVSLNPIWATFHFMDEKWVFLYKDVVIAHYSVEQYGRTWRCWSRRPDPKQMEATPWPGA